MSSQEIAFKLDEAEGRIEIIDNYDGDPDFLEIKVYIDRPVQRGLDALAYSRVTHKEGR